MVYDQGASARLQLLRSAISSDACAGKKQEALLRIQELWSIAQTAFNEKSMHMNAFLSFGHLLSQALVARDETRAAELILKSGAPPTSARSYA